MQIFLTLLIFAAWMPGFPSMLTNVPFLEGKTRGELAALGFGKRQYSAVPSPADLRKMKIKQVFNLIFGA